MVAGKTFTVESLLLILMSLVLACTPATPLTPTSPGGPSTGPSPAVPTSAGTASATPKPTVDQPRYGGILTIGDSGDPPSLDPRRETSVIAIGPVGPIFNNLIAIDPLDPDKVVPDLAEKWEISPDGLTYTFYLRKGVKWHDGASFGARDIVYNIDSFRNPPRGLPSPRKDILNAVSKAEHPDDSTVKVSLSHPAASLILNISAPVMLMVPQHKYEPLGAERPKVADAVGTGPFKLKDWNTGVSFEVSKNSGYFVQGRPYLDGIRVYFIPDKASRFAALRTGRVLMLRQTTAMLSVAEIEQVKKEMSDRIVVETAWFPAFYGLDMNVQKGRFTDVRVRKAVNLALDRQAAVRLGLLVDPPPGWLMAPLGKWSPSKDELFNLPGYRQPKEPDINEAKRLMAEAGYPGGFEAELLIRRVYPCPELGEFISNQLSKINIRMKLNVTDNATYYDILNRKAYEISLAFYGTPVDEPDGNLADYVTGGGRNYAGYSRPEVDELYKKQAEVMVFDQRRKMVLDFQRMVWEDMPRAMIFWGVTNHGRWRQIRNTKLGGTFIPLRFEDVWLAG